MTTRLRPWQTEAVNKAMNWLLFNKKDKRFLINAAPGAGKTIAACSIAKSLIEKNEIDRVIVIAPRTEVVNQWASDFHRVTGRFMGKITACDDIDELGIDVCATWSAVQGLQDALQAVCKHSRVLVICDEHHHAAVEAAWGSGTGTSFEQAKYAVILTGTPIRTDGAKSVWLAYDEMGAISHPEEGTYNLSYGEAVDLGYCRPVTFHRHEGRFSIDLEDGNTIQVSGEKPAELTSELRRIPGLQSVLNFYRLARTPQFKADGITPLPDGYQATMIERASEKLTQLRHRMPDAGGLVIAPTIEMAEYMVKLIEQIEGEKPILVHSQLPNSESKIRGFRNTDRRWIVSVAMISEGVDIRRLRVLVYLPNALTELSFRQAIGRVVRTAGPDDDTRAYVVMPSFDTFEAYARRVEEEMSPSSRAKNEGPDTKRCSICFHENNLSAFNCEECGNEFPKLGFQKFRTCDDCGSLNPIGSHACNTCGNSFRAKYVLTLDEALRNGAIIRGMDVDESEVAQSESMAEIFRDKIIRSGDAKLIHILKVLPEESYARLKGILEGP